MRTIEIARIAKKNSHNHLNSNLANSRPTSQMEFISHTKAQANKAGSEDGNHSNAHTLLSMYSNAPSEQVTLDEFERLALERLRGGLHGDAQVIPIVKAIVMQCSRASKT